MSNLENTEGVTVEFSLDMQDSSLDILSDLMLNPDKLAPVVDTRDLGEILPKISVEIANETSSGVSNETNANNKTEEAITDNSPQELTIDCGNINGDDQYGLNAQINHYTQDDDLSRVYERMNNCRKNAIYKDIELQKINFVLEKEGYSTEEINELYQTELQSNEELRNNIVEQAAQLGWKGKSRMSDSPPQRRNRYAGLEKETGVKDEKRPTSVVSTPVEVIPVLSTPRQSEVKPEEKVLPPKNMYIPAKEMIKAMFSNENDKSDVKSQQSKTAQTSQRSKSSQNPADLITPQDILKGEIINPNFNKKENFNEKGTFNKQQSTDENLVNAIAACDKSQIKKYMNYNVDDVLKGIRLAPCTHRKKIIRYLASICGELFIQHLLDAATGD